MNLRSLFFATTSFLAIAGLSIGSAPLKAETLKLASWGPPSHFVPKATAEWVSEVNDRAGGQIEVVEYPGGQLYGPSDMHRAVARGTVDLGVALQPQMMGMVPMLQGVYLPFAFDSLQEAAQAYTGESREIIEKALEEKGIKLVYVSFLDGVQLFSGETNLETIADFQNQRVLASSPIVTEILTRLGASVDTSVPQNEQYMALKLGVADAVTQSIVGGYFQNTYEVAPRVSMLNMSFPTILIIMNKRKWDALSPEVQELMRSAGEKQAQKTMAAAKGWEQKFTGELQKVGATVTVLADSERARIRDLSEEVWQQWAEDNGADAQRLLELNLKGKP